MNNRKAYNLVMSFKRGQGRILLFLIISMMGIGNVWAQTVSKWDGTTKTAPDMSENNGSSETLAIRISNAAELAWFGEQMSKNTIASGKAYGGKYWKLTADIDLGGKSDFAGEDWSGAIGNTTNAFCGYFDGNNHTVSNIQVKAAATQKYYGLFPSVQGASTTNVSTVKNLKINGAYFKATTSMANTTRIGALIGYAKQASISNVVISNVNYTYTGDITNENDLGGAIGCAEATVSIESVSVSSVSADFTGTTANLYVAGLVGKINSHSSVNKCSTKDVTITYNTIANASRISGLIGYTKGAANAPISINGCSVSNTKVNLKAGINNGSYIGALVAQAADNTQIGDGTDANKNTVTSPEINIGGDIKAASYIGGAIGDLAGAADATKTSVVKKLTVTSPKIKVNNYSAGTSLTGGVFGRISTYTAIDGVNLTGTTLSFTKDLSVAQQIGTFAGTITGNATQQISVKNVTIDKSELTFGTAATSNAVGLMAGVIGQVSTNVELDTWKVAGNANIKINGNLITSSSYIGGFAGYVITGANAPVSIKNIEFKGTSTVSVSGSTKNATQYLGGFVGSLASGDKTDTKVVVDNVKINGHTYVSIAGVIGNSQLKADNTTEYKGDVRVGGFAGLIQGRSKSNNVVEINALTLNNVSLTASSNVVTGSYLGGLAGYITTSCTLTECTIGNPTISVDGEVKATSYFGGAIGRLDGAASYPSSATNMTVGTSQITFGSKSSTKDYAGLRAGVIGYSQNNVTLQDWTVASSSVKVNGNLITSGSCIGGFAGYVTTGANAPISIKNIEFKDKSTVSVSGNTKNATQYLGGVVGYLVSGNSSDTKVVVDNVKINGLTSVSVAGVIGNSQLKADNTTEYKGDVRVGGFAGVILGRAQSNNSVEISSITLGDTEIEVGGNVIASSYIAGLAGYAATACKFDTWAISKPTVTIKGDITAASYVGGAFGNVTGATNYPSVLTNITVEDMDISFGGNLSNTLYVGGITGQLAATETTPNKIENCTVSGKIYNKGNHTFKENVTYSFGGIVGYTGQSATKISEVSQCISNVDFNLGGLTPATRTNLYRSRFIVGGVIGRIDAPSRLPEHLYYTGKIYAPYATVAPIVGVFSSNVAAATYLYNDYSGENAANINAQEWQKANTWYFTGYKLGLSPEVISQNARTRNYTSTPTLEDGINYLLVDDKTFAVNNKIGAEAKKSFTVLAYNQDNKDVDHGIYPQWNKNQSDYPTYYMYYMQGVNRGVFTPKEESNFARLLMDNKLSFTPQMIHTGGAGHGYEFIVDAGRIEDNSNFTISYQWFKSDKTTPLQGETSKILGITKTDLDAAGGTIYCVVTVSGGDSSVKRTLMGMASTVVFVDGKNGIDNAKGSRERGWTPNTAVKTIDNANLLLDGGSWDKNIIVVMGMLNSGVLFQSTGSNPATLTGKWDGTDYFGIIEIDKTSSEDNVNKANQAGQRGHHNYVKADTKFEYLTFQCKSNTNDNNFIECHGNDVWFGKGLVMNNFRNLSEDHGNLEMNQNIPELSIILTATNLSEADIKTYLNRNKPQTLTIESGHYGRVMGGRFTNKFFPDAENTSHTILGSPEHPVWAIVNIDIDKENLNKGTINRFEGTGTGTVTDAFTCDINCIIAGLTDGSMYGDYEINVHGGKVSYIVGGNQGNPVPNGSKTFTQPGGKSGNWGQWPNTSYFGRTVINVEQDPNLKAITIENLYTGGLGRKANGNNATSVVDMYMYGHTEINMKSGTVLGNVYGGGAGGVMGINPWDMHVPYATTETDNTTNAIMNGVQYGTWGSKQAGSPLANVTLHDSDGNGGYTEKIQNLGESYTTLNISGGTINGNVYGGGCGFVSNMPKEVAMQGVGSVFGTSNVNISGGTIKGSVYGGSEGSDKYFDATNKYNQKINHIAEMNGTVNLNISGMENGPTIGGAIYGGGQGVVSASATQEYPRIATTGYYDTEKSYNYKTDINITIDMPENIEFSNDIYGGGALGMVDGTTNIVLKHGNFTGNIYGGGYGEKNHLDKAMVNGDITISTGDANPANVDRALPVMVSNTIYGGGNMAQVTGNTFVNIHHGNITGDVFGGGKGLTSSESGTEPRYGKVTGNTHVLYFNTTANNSINGNIYGGGALGAVEGDTEVTIKDGVIKGNVFGAGKGEEGHPDKAKVTGNTNVIVVNNK